MIQFEPKLVLTGRNEERLHRVGELCKKTGLAEDRLLLVVADVTKDADLERLVDTTIKTFQQIDVLVNNAATIAYHDTLETTMAEFDLIMNTNIRSPFYLTKLCLPHLIKTKGTIVNISSISGQRAHTGEVSYCISKAALDHFSSIIAMEFANKGVRVNTVSPGVIWSNIQKKGGMSEEEYNQYMVRQRETHPLGRVGDPVEVAKAIVFLASDDSSFTTGNMLHVDGGRHTKPV